MKKVLFTLLAIFMVVSLAACNSSSKKETSEEGKQELAKELILFSFGEYFPDEVLKDFEKEFNVKVIYDPYGSNAEMLTKLQSGAVAYDIAVPTDYIVGRMIKKDMLLPLDMKNIPNFKNINKLFHERPYDPDNKYSVPYLYGSIGLAYDQSKVKNPVGWEDLWNPEYAGHILLSDIGRETVSVALQKLGYSQNDVTDESMEKAKQELIALDKNVYVYDSAPADVLSGNDIWIAATYSGEVAAAMKNNENLQYMIPKEGGTLWMDNFVIPKTSKNKFTAETFINYILRPDVSKKITDAIPYSNPNDAAVELMTEEERNNPASYPNAADLERAEWFTDLGEDLQKVDHVWREVMSK